MIPYYKRKIFPKKTPTFGEILLTSFIKAVYTTVHDFVRTIQIMQIITNHAMQTLLLRQVMGNRTCSICHFSQSTCQTLRLMSSQEKQEQGYTCSTA